ncbi:MAG: 30S ribosomal protein S20 [Acidobacteriota bacterium]
MANTKQALKRVRQNLKQRARNRAHLSRMRTAVKKLRTAIGSGDADTARNLLTETLSIVDRTAQKGVIHANAAARTKSRLTTQVNALG